MIKLKYLLERFRWTSSTEGTVDYYERILKSKYLK